MIISYAFYHIYRIHRFKIRNLNMVCIRPHQIFKSGSVNPKIYRSTAITHFAVFYSYTGDTAQGFFVGGDVVALEVVGGEGARGEYLVDVLRILALMATDGDLTEGDAHSAVDVAHAPDVVDASVVYSRFSPAKFRGIGDYGRNRRELLGIDFEVVFVLPLGVQGLDHEPGAFGEVDVGHRETATGQEG